MYNNLKIRTQDNFLELRLELSDSNQLFTEMNENAHIKSKESEKIKRKK